MNANVDANCVLDFWRDAGPRAWWTKSDEFDNKIRSTFGDLYEKAIADELDDWRAEPQSSLALIILLDQFSRNLNRNSARAFASDAYCLEIATAAIEQGHDKAEEIFDLRNFYYLPLMHAENLAAQRLCIHKMHAIDNQQSLDAAITHFDIIKRFGRFPHRNPVLGRHTTPAEHDFLEGGGFSG